MARVRNCHALPTRMTGPGRSGVGGFCFLSLLLLSPGLVRFLAEEIYGMQDGAVHPEAMMKLKVKA